MRNYLIPALSITLASLTGFGLIVLTQSPDSATNVIKALLFSTIFLSVWGLGFLGIILFSRDTSTSNSGLNMRQLRYDLYAATIVTGIALANALKLKLWILLALLVIVIIGIEYLLKIKSRHNFVDDFS